jgi:hypothetical protein
MKQSERLFQAQRTVLLISLAFCLLCLFVMWSICRLRAFHYNVPKRLFGTSKEVPGGWSKVYKEDLHNLYASPYIKGKVVPVL